SPLRGGVGGGGASANVLKARRRHPTPSPSPQGGGERVSIGKPQTYSTHWINAGPRIAHNRANVRSKSSASLHRAAATPCASASFTKSNVGESSDSIDAALGPGLPAPVRASSMLRIR